MLKNTLWPENLPLISIIIPCTDDLKNLSDTVESILSQTWEDFELILVANVASSTLTSQASKSPKIRTELVPGMNSLTRARFAGFKLACGKYIFSIKPGDLIVSSYVAQAIGHLETEGVDSLISRTKAVPFPALTERTHDFSAEFLIKCGIPKRKLPGGPVSDASVFRRDFWETRMAPHAHLDDDRDWNFWLSLALKKGSHIELDKVVHAKRAEAKTSSRTRNFENRFELLKAALSPSNFRQRSKRTKVDQPYLNLVDRVHLGTHPSTEAQKTQVLVCVPWVDLGGSSVLMSEVFSHLVQSGEFAFSTVSTIWYREEFSYFGHSRFKKFANPVFDLYYVPTKHQESLFLKILEVKKPDVLMITDSQVAYDLLPVIKKKYPDLKVVDQIYNVDGVPARMNLKYAEYIDLNLVANPEVKHFFVSNGQSPSKNQIVYHGIDHRHFSPKNLKRDLNASRPFTLGFLGRFSPEKKPEDFISVLTHLPEARGILCGFGLIKEDLIKQANSLGVSSRLDVCALKDVLDFYKQIDLLVVPSRVEGLPLVLLEAMALGIPCVATPVGAIPEVVKNAENGYLFEVGNLEALASQVRKYQSLSLEEKEVMSGKAIQAIEERFTLELCSENYKTAFKQLLNQKDSSAISSLQTLVSR